MYVSLNNALYREVRSDYPSDIFPKAACKRTNLGDGDTFFSVEQIVIAIDTYYTQCQKIAKLLKGNTLQATCRNIHQFLYHHFQYKADSEVQQLRSPACSWAQRFIGIDCKSYTILAGSIIKALGYNSYVRQIKQPYSTYPDQYNHVYLIVPISQKDNDLRKGYYVIDGTVPTTKEALYSEKADEIVTAMKHIGLNGAQNALYDFKRSKGYQGLGARSDGNPSAGSGGGAEGTGSAGGSGAGSGNGKGKFTLDKLGNIVDQSGRILVAASGVTHEILTIWGIVKPNNNHTNPAPNNPPDTGNSDVYRKIERELEEARRRNSNQQNQNYNQNQDYNTNRNNNQNYNPYYPQQPVPNGTPKDHTLIYVIGGVAIVGLLVVVMMNKK